MLYPVTHGTGLSRESPSAYYADDATLSKRKPQVEQCVRLPASDFEHGDLRKEISMGKACCKHEGVKYEV